MLFYNHTVIWTITISEMKQNADDFYSYLDLFMSGPTLLRVKYDIYTFC